MAGSSEAGTQRPPYVITADQQRRWDAAAALAEAMFEDLDPGERATQVWAATRAMYSSDIPTDDPERTPA